MIISLATLHPERHRRRADFALLWSLFFLVFFSSCSLGPSNSNNAPPPEFICASPTTNPITIKWLYESEEQPWVDAMVKAFNKSSSTACDGPITVQATPMGTAQAMEQILNGEQKPDIWSPASSAWLPLLNAEWHAKNGYDLISSTASDNPSVLSSPLVIAMWQSEVQALGWSGNNQSWNAIAGLMTNPQTWEQAKAGDPNAANDPNVAQPHPEFGQFKLVNTSAMYSNAGLAAAMTMAYTATCNVNVTPSADNNGISNSNASCKQSGLTTDDVTNSAAKTLFSTLESSAWLYGSNANALLAQMASQGYGAASAIPVDENQIFAVNDKKKYPHLPSPIVAVYPAEGTVMNDYPFAVLQKKDLSLSIQGAARVFLDFLLSDDQQNQDNQYGFRPAIGSNVSFAHTGSFDGNHGVDPTQQFPTLPFPDPNVVRAIRTTWQQTRRPFTVALVAGRSGSMNLSLGGIAKIDGAKTGFKQFVNFMGDQDQLGITTFSSHVDQPLTDITTVGPKRTNILSRIDGLYGDGGSVLYDAVKQEFQALQKIPAKSLRAMIVLSDEPDSGSSTSLNQLLSTITPPAGQDPTQAIKIFAIAYGHDADSAALAKIAAATGGQAYNATPQNLADIYQMIGEQF